MGNQADSGPGSAAVRCPFSLELRRIERLVVCDVADDPHYVGIEVQVFDDETHGRGVAVLLGRKDGLVDVYRQSGLRLEPDDYRIGAGLGEWAEAEIDPARFEIAADGTVIEVGLNDKAGRRVALAIDDRDGQERQRGDLLAPMGSTIVDPVSLMLVYMRGFDFVRTGGSPPWLSIGGQARELAPFPGPRFLHRRYFARYAESPLVVTLNRQYEGPLERSVATSSPTLIQAGAGPHSAALRVHPCCPDLDVLGPEQRLEGSWELEIGGVDRFLTGEWSAHGSEDGAALSLAVTSGWRPRDLPPLLRLVTAMAKVFRAWPTTYRWNATLERTAAGPVLRGGWTRT